MRGSGNLKLDDKSRLTLPAKYRVALTEEVAVVCESERCLAVYARSVLDQLMGPINAAQPTHLKVRDYQRWFNSRAEDAIPDKLGRVTITPSQRAWAGLDKDVFYVAAGSRLEIWNPDAWQAYSAVLDDKFADFDGEIVPQG